MSHSSSRTRRGFTLVEMMIAMIITLLIVFAMVEAFRTVGESTTEGRASIEMLSAIRQVRYRLEEDLSRCTAPPHKEIDRSSASEADQAVGYFEHIEGGGNDTTPARYLVRTPTGLMYNTFNFANANDTTAADSATLFGDLDDILMCTIRNDEQPFRGRYGTVVIESPYAEVIWWAELNDKLEDVDGNGTIDPPQDTNGDGVIDVINEGGYGQWDPGETFTIRRRILLIRPDLNNGAGILAGVSPLPGGTNLQDHLERELQTFRINNDISVHVHYDATSAVAGIGANSLGDLAYRHNRTAHRPIDTGLFDTGNMTRRGLSRQPGVPISLSPVNVRMLPAYTDPNLYGEDVMLTNTLAFDFRVWDPHAPVCGYAPDPNNIEVAEGIVPGDPGFNTAIVANNQNVATGAGVTGRGAFVDLGALAGNVAVYNRSVRTTNGFDDDGNGANDNAEESYLNPQFVGGMDVRSLLFNAGMPIDGNLVYDNFHPHLHEKDLFNQEDYCSPGLVNEGKNDLDDNTTGGIDDEFEREILRPYKHNLEAVQVKIRMYEADTRQVRQVSQTVRFGDGD